MKSLRIGQIGAMNLPIPPQKYGGTERIIYYLCEGLKNKNHQVFLFDTKEAKVSCNLVPILEKGLWQKKVKETTPYYAYEMALIAKKAQELKLDILHDHLGPWSLTLYGQTKIPIIHTLHVNLNKDRIWAYKKLNAQLVSLSFAQRKKAPHLNYVANIYNGIDVQNFPFQKKPENYFLWVGELSPRKGIFEVIEIAKKAKIKLVIAGRIPSPKQKEDHFFFQKYIAKKLNKNNIVYIGERNINALKPFYKNAKAFLFPLQWEEPFGLVMVEAQACGTPVIAFKRGSVPEVVKNKETGFVINPWNKNKKPNLEGFLEAIKNIDKISREKCRQWVVENFSSERMVTDYEKLYYQILAKTK
jgi:glycosyltransferase involved in cell wall biosynthesis